MIKVYKKNDNYDTWTLLLNIVSEHRYSYDTHKIYISEVPNSKNICWISDNSNTILKRKNILIFLKLKFIVNFFLIKL